MAADTSVAQCFLYGALAGAVAGAFSDSILHPLDTLRARLNARNSSEVSGHPIRAFLAVAREGRVYQGFSATLSFAAPAYALFFGAYEASQLLLPEKWSTNEATSDLVGGLAAEYERTRADVAVERTITG